MKADGTWPLVTRLAPIKVKSSSPGLKCAASNTDMAIEWQEPKPAVRVRSTEF
jgi:hypothetical protein